MTADRLRRAAAKFDEMYAVAYHDGIESVDDLSDQIAALLRAVADVRGDLPLSMCYVCDNTDGHEPWCIHGCALALADVILGGDQ